jgi:hypothetical protein
MNFQEILNSRRTSILISVLLGFGLATLFKRKCRSPDCYVFKGPHHTKIMDNVFKMGGRCYNYDKQHKSCNTFNKNVINFEILDQEE